MMNRREWLVAAFAAAQEGMQAGEGVPSVTIGGRRISRLLVGGNPISGNSHVSPELSREMADYFTAARVKALATGDVPSPLADLRGCVFRSRCPVAFGRCGEEEPVLLTRDKSSVACWGA